MREIKFRAWDKLNNQMVEVLQIKTAGEEYDYEAFLQKDYIYGRTGTENFTIGKSDCELMQFTGLTDHHGVAIYEGDIVKTSEEIGEVRYSESEAEFIILFLPHNDKKRCGATGLGNTWPSPIKEVIGNIYENPELLK